MMDHCHLTGRFRGPAHKECNLNDQSRTILVVFHNFTGWDSHLTNRKNQPTMWMFHEEIATYFNDRVVARPQNKDRCISFVKQIDRSDTNFRFIDSFPFRIHDGTKDRSKRSLQPH